MLPSTPGQQTSLMVTRNDQPDVFVHDRLTGQTRLVSVSSSGQQGNQGSHYCSISGDGRYVAFQSEASNPVTGDTNGRTDVFVHDVLTGETTRVSVSSTGRQGNDYSRDPSISRDGRYVAFDSYSTNLVFGDTNLSADIFVYDQQTRQTARVSVNSLGKQADRSSFYPSISGDGRYVSFESAARNLVSGDSNNNWDVFVRDQETGQTERVSVNSTGEEGNGLSEKASISDNGRFVAFQSSASNLAGGDYGYLDIFVHDRLTRQTERASVSSGGQQANDHSIGASISGDGHFVAFESTASNLVQGDTNGKEDIFVHQYLPGTKVPPESLAVFRGTVEAGGLAEVLASDDQYLVVRNGMVALRSESPVIVDATYTSPLESVSSMSIRWENRVSIEGLQQRLQMRNYLGEFVDLDGRAAPVHDLAVNIEVPNPNDFIVTGTRRMTTRHIVEPAGPLFTGIWRSLMDEISIVIGD